MIRVRIEVVHAHGEIDIIEQDPHNVNDAQALNRVLESVTARALQRTKSAINAKEDQ